MTWTSPCTRLEKTHIIRSSNGDAVLMRVPAHMQNLLVKVDLVGVGLLAHALGTASRRAGPATLLAILGVHGRGDSDLLRLECALVGLQDNLGVLIRITGIDHEVVVVRAGHDISCITGESDFKLVKDAVILVGVA